MFPPCTANHLISFRYGSSSWSCVAWPTLEGGYRLGSWRHARATDEKETPVGAMVGSILGLLAFLLAVGYQSGLSATLRSPAMVGMVLAFAGVMILIADLDRGSEGFLTVSPQALLDLQKNIHVMSP